MKKTTLKKPDRFYIRRLLVMLLGIVIMGLGVGLFKLSLMGNDPCNAFVMALADTIGFPFAMLLPVVNAAFFLIELLFGRKYIGVGTVINWLCVGYLTTFWVWFIRKLFTIPDNLVIHLMVMVLGVLILSLSCALYQTADTGISPFDSISIIMAERLPVPYFWCRIFTDSLCALGAWLLGGIVGLGTLFCALGLGPFITFFTRTVAEKMVGKPDNQ